MFQSTHPRGVRHNSALNIWARCVVSIHAPTRGATLSMEILCKSSGFQSTHPRGVRQGNYRSCRRYGCFNPRTHEGCDDEEVARCQGGGVSIHAPTRGATHIQDIFLCRQCFNPRTHEGCDLSGTKADIIQEVSIHAPTRGATQLTR